MQILPFLYPFFQFMIQHQKNYNENVFYEKFNVFVDNYKYIQEINNRENVSFTLKVNKFADLTNDEFQKLYLGSKISEPKASNCGVFSDGGSTPPKNLDWRDKKIVTPVKDQGQCGSCWAFAATEVLESAYALKHNELPILAPQELVDCDKTSFGCSGGYPEQALIYIEQHGLEKESDYPYRASDGTCKGKDTQYKLDKCFDVSANDEKALQRAVALAPVLVVIEADQRVFQFYHSGIIDGKSCGQNLDHAVQLVGYGQENDEEYWLVRNSWGEGWGENGYVKLQKNSGITGGTCGIARGPSGFYV